jgi:hypothetical protein
MSGAAAAVLVMPDTSADCAQYPGLGPALLADAEALGREVAGDDVRFAAGGAGLIDAVGQAFAGHNGPLLVVWPILPRFRREHAEAALGDLAAGCDVVLGPVIDGGLYLLGLARPLDELASIPDELWQGPDVMAIGLAAARDGGLEVGILRAERALRSPSDVRASLADPLLPTEIRRILQASNGPQSS